MMTIYPEVFAILHALARGGAEVDPISLCQDCRQVYISRAEAKKNRKRVR